MPIRLVIDPSSNRTGNVLALSALMMAVMAVLLAFAIDVGYLFVARNQLQNSADSAALAGAWQLLDERRLQGDLAMELVASSARQEAVQYASQNRVCAASPSVDMNSANHPQGDVVFGRYSRNGGMTTLGDIRSHNAVQVRVSRTGARNGEVPLFFARVMGWESLAVTAEAVATFRDGIRGFQPTPDTGNTSLIPFTIHVDQWEALISGAGNDDWTYEVETGEVKPGSDGVSELVFYPNDPGAPGNFGTLEIGNPDNGTPDLIRQIRDGLSAEDLSYHDGKLELDPLTNTMFLRGDTGISSGIKSGLQDIVGLQRTICLHDTVASPGNNAEYRIVGFVGVRVLDFWLDGKNWREEQEHYVIVQPAIVTDDSALAGGDPQTSDFVYQPAILVK